MAIVRTNRNDGFNSSGRNNSNRFQEHNERMTELRRSHANVAMVNGPRCGEAAFLASLPPLQVRRITMETGGSRLLNGTSDWSALVPVLKVARYKLSQN